MNVNSVESVLLQAGQFEKSFKNPHWRETL